MKPVSHGLHSNRALEGQKLLVSTPFVLNALGFFSQPYKGAPALGRAACELEAAGTRWSARSLQPLARPAARARVTFTSICAAQGILVSPERWRRVRAGPARQAAAGLLSIAVTRVEAHPLLQGSDPCAVSWPRFRAILWFPCDSLVPARAVLPPSVVSERSAVARLSSPTQSAHVRPHRSKGVPAVKESS